MAIIGAGRYGNYVMPQQDNEFDRKVQQCLDGKASERDADFDSLPLDEVAVIVGQSAKTNAERYADAIAHADSLAFRVVHPEYIPTAENDRLMNHQLQTWGIKDGTFHYFERAYEHLKDRGLLTLDKGEIARQQDHPLKSWKGVLTGRSYDSIDGLIANERQAAIAKMGVSDGERALDNLPQEQALNLIKKLEHTAQHESDAAEMQANCDAWISLRPDYRDSIHNGKLLTNQLRSNGVTGVASIEQLEIADRDLQASGLLERNPKQVAKQQEQAIRARAEAAVAEGGSVWDQATEDDMYEMDLEEVRKRANKVLGRR